MGSRILILNGHPDTTRKGLFAAWDRKFLGDNVRVYGDAFYQDVFAVDGSGERFAEDL